MSRILFILVSLFFAVNCQFSTGVIIENNNQLIRNLENDILTKLLINNIKKNYNAVVISVPIQELKNTTYSNNFNFLIEELINSNIKVYFNLLTTTNDIEFNNIFENNRYKNIVNTIKTIINKFPYEGITVNIRWHSKNKENINNYIEVLKFISNEFPKTKRYAIAPILPNKDQNKLRGYDEDQILKYFNSFISSLYVREYGFYKRKDKIVPNLDEWKILLSKNYCKLNNYKAAVALDYGAAVFTNNFFYAYLDKIHKTNLARNINVFQLEEENTFYFSTQKYKVINDMILKNLSIKQNSEIFTYEVKFSIISDDDFVYEYFEIYR